MITKELLKKLEQDALKVALAKSQYNKADFSNIRIDRNGLTVVFSVGCHGFYEDERFNVKLEDLDKTEEELKNEYQLEIKEVTELLLKKMEEEREEKRIAKEKKEAAKEEADYIRFLELKDKFETKKIKT